MRCSPNRAYRLPASCLLNISHGKRLIEKKAGGDRQSIQTSQTPRASSGISYAAAAHHAHTPPVTGNPRTSYSEGTRPVGRSSSFQDYSQANHVTGGFDMVDSPFGYQTPPNPWGPGKGRGFKRERSSEAVSSKVGASLGKTRNGSGFRVVDSTPSRKNM